MRKIFGLIIFGLVATSAALAMEDDGLSPIMREALRKAKQDREIFDKELKQLDRELDRDTPCPWEGKKVTLPTGVAVPGQSKDDEDASPKEGEAATKRPLVLAVSAPAPTIAQVLMPSKKRGAVGATDVTNTLLGKDE